MVMNNLLCIYGSLLNASNEFAAYLNKYAHVYTTGKFNGKLYDIGEYPGAIASTEDTNWVSGTVMLLNHPETTLSVIDDYEGYGPDQEQPNLFIRELATINTPKGRMVCWIYLYNLPVTGLRQITSGDYLRS